MNKDRALHISAFLLILLFFYTGLSKLLSYEAFKNALEKSDPLRPIASVVALAIPLGELAIAIFLAMPTYQKIGFWASSILMFMFTIYVIVILQFSKSLPCTCGGVIQKLSWKQHLYFNIIFLIISVSGVVLERKYNPHRNIHPTPF